MPENNTTVYIVDDDDAVRQSLASLLELEGYDVREYETAGAFLSDVNASTVGVLLLDIRLPDINGLEVQAKLVSVRAAETEMQQSGTDSKEQQDIRARLELLAPRELDVFRHLVIGRQNKVIAYELGISPRTVEVYRARLMGKMQANSLSHLVRMALSIGLDTDGI